MTPERFIGRNKELRTLFHNVEHRHPTLVIAHEGYGKTALLQTLEAALAPTDPVLALERLTPFGTFLRDLYTQLWNRDLFSDRTGDLRNDLRAWGREHPSNDAKARHLLGLIRQHGELIILIDDASGITPSNHPHLEQLVDSATVIAAVTPKALAKRGTKRFWKRFEELQLELLTRKEAADLLDNLLAHYGVQPDEPAIYRRKVLELAQGSPFELTRLVKHHATEGTVRAADLSGYAQGFVERDEKGFALAPLLLLVGAAGIALRYIARAQGNLDLYVLGGIGIALFIAVGPWIRRSIKPRSS